MLNNVFHTLLISIFVLLPALCVKCSSPVSGVETGNPAMTASAQTALNLLSNSSAWQPETYLTNGKNQLDPNSIVSSNESHPLSKRTSGTESGNPGATNMTIVKWVDTIINISQVFVNDTITRTRTKADTSLFQNESGTLADSALVVTEKTVSEKLFIIDTVTIYDTFTVTHYDTLRRSTDSTVPETSSPPGTRITISQPTPSVKATSNDMDVYLEVASQSKNYILPAEYTSSTTEVYSRISRSGSIASMNIFEEYSDADGDGNLLASSAGSVPLVNLTATYSLQAEKQSLLVQFDPGEDRSFSHTADNKIHSLHKVKKYNDVTIEDITFVKTQPFSGTDTLLLTIARSPQSDSISSVTTQYSFLASNPASVANYDVNKMVKAQYTAHYRNNAAASVELTIVPDTQLEPGSIPSKASLIVYVDYGKGSTGHFDGSIDYTSKSVTGVYSENGTEFEYTYDGISGESDFVSKK